MPRKLEKTLLLRGEPSLKNQYVPEVMLPVPVARQMFFPFLPDGRRREETFVAETFGIEQLFGPVPQRPTQPGVDGNAETHFGPLDQFSRDVSVEYLAKQPLALAAFDLHRKRKAPGELHHAMVEQRYARFQADRH